jgi:hypothetical protein
MALTWLMLSSVGSKASSCRRTCCRQFSSMIACWYSEEAPPVSFRALLTFLIRSVGKLVSGCHKSTVRRQVLMAPMKSPTENPNAGIIVGSRKSFCVKPRLRLQRLPFGTVTTCRAIEIQLASLERRDWKSVTSAQWPYAAIRQGITAGVFEAAL